MGASSEMLPQWETYDRRKEQINKCLHGCAMHTHVWLRNVQRSPHGLKSCLEYKRSPAAIGVDTERNVRGP